MQWILGVQNIGTPETMGALIAPMSVASFIPALEEGRRLLLRGGSRNFTGLLDWPLVNAILEQDILTPHDSNLQMRLVRGGVWLPDQAWFSPFRRPRIGAPALLNLLRQGATIVMNRIDLLHRPLGRLRDDISAALQAKIWMNAYLTFGHSAGLDIHFDGHDVIAVQIHGSKLWHFYDDPECLPIRAGVGDAGRRRSAAAEERLNSGDLLFIPRGEWHSAVNRAENGQVPSVHLAIGIQPVRGIDLVNALRRRAEANPLFRRDLPRFSGAAAIEDFERSLKEAIRGLLEEIALSGLLPHGYTADAPGAVSHDVPKAIPEIRDDTPAPELRRFHLPDLGFHATK